jgi:transmembrane sensor
MGNEISEIVMRILQGIQTEGEMHAFLQWYRASRDNQELLFQLKHLYELRKGGLRPDDAEITASWERLREKLEKRTTGHLSSPSKTRGKKGFMVRRYAVVAAVAVLLVVVGIALFQQQHAPVEWVEVRTDPKSEPRTILLPDGSSVQLNASSLFRYPEKFKTKQREVYLDGEAYFNVTKDTRRTFIVHTGKQRVNVLGTEFNILGYASDPYIITTLITGRVNLGIYDRENNLENEIVMLPNQQVYFNKEEHRTTLTEVNPRDAVSWINGVYSFRDTPLEEIARRLEKVHGLAFVIPEEAQRKEEYTGKFFSNQTIDEVADVLNFKGQFRIQFNNDTLFIRGND